MTNAAMSLPTDVELAALRAFKAKHGRCWKQVLRDRWMDGNWDYDSEDSQTLQTIRNTRGPSWLISVRID